jgi:3-oxoacyl-[acyl-carrier-protein] synthase III
MLDISIYLPENILTNEILKSEFPDWDHLKIQDKIGIRQRHIAGISETALDLAYRASEAVLLNKKREDVDFIILCTQSPDFILPTSACILQDKLGLSTNIGALDFNLGCSGFVYGLSMAKGLISAGISEKLLFVTAETYTKHINRKDIANRALFGDGATATLISKQDLFRIGQFTLGTDGRGKNNLIVQNGGQRNAYEIYPLEIEYGNGNFYTKNNLYMNGPEIFNFTIESVPPLVTNNLKENNLTIDEIDYFIFHQANQFMLEYLRRKLGIPMEKFCIDLAETGNTVSCTIPIALKNAWDRGVIKEGNKVMLVGFGVGYSWGAVIIEI